MNLLGVTQDYIINDIYLRGCMKNNLATTQALKWVDAVTSATTDEMVHETLKYTVENILQHSEDITFIISDKNKAIVFTDTNSQECSGKTDILGRISISLRSTMLASTECTITAHLTKNPDIKSPPLSINFISSIKEINLQPKNVNASTSTPVTLTATVTGIDNQPKSGVLVLFDAPNGYKLSEKTNATNEKGQAVTELSGSQIGTVTVTATAADKNDNTKVTFHTPDYVLEIDASPVYLWTTSGANSFWVTVTSPSGKKVDSLPLTVNLGKYLYCSNIESYAGGRYELSIFTKVTADILPPPQVYATGISVSYLQETSNFAGCEVGYNWR